MSLPAVASVKQNVPSTADVKSEPKCPSKRNKAESLFHIREATTVTDHTDYIDQLAPLVEPCRRTYVSVKVMGTKLPNKGKGKGKRGFV